MRHSEGPWRTDTAEHRAWVGRDGDETHLWFWAFSELGWEPKLLCCPSVLELKFWLVTAKGRFWMLNLRPPVPGAAVGGQQRLELGPFQTFKLASAGTGL